jgi:PERQ amino acid-rich with GYF domain-containing protein
VVIDDDDKNVQALETENKLDDSELLNLGDQVEDFPPTDTYESPTQALDNFSLPAVGRATSRFSSFAIPDEMSHQPEHLNQDDREPRLDQLPAPVYADDHEDDVLNDILSMAADPRTMSPPRQMDRLTSRFAQQSLAESSGYGAFGGVGPFDADPIRRDSTSMSQFFGGGQPQPPVPKAGLFEHPVVPQQPALPPVPPQTTRVMIMADKLKWVYKDPHGHIQGPFTGLEMHEWYRGGYFHSTLEVRREDDHIWEQLQNLVKRIGNQREPFLVPLPSKTQTQPIPPRSTTTLSAWNTTLFGEGQEEVNPWVAPAPTLPAAAISGTTLTADQQNALERRKQEEQYMLVRQRELAAQQQISHAPAVHPLLHQQSPQHFVPSPAAFGGFSPMHPLPLGITHHVHTPAPVQVQTLPALDALRTGGTLETPAPPQQLQSPLERQAQGGLGFQQQQPSRGFISPWGAGPLGPLTPGMVQMHQQPQSQESYLPQQYSEESQFAPERKASVPLDTPAEMFEHPVSETVLDTVDQSRNSSVSVASAKHEVASPVTQIEPEESEINQEDDFIPEIVASSETADDIVDHPTVTPSPARVAPWATPQKKDESKKSLSLKQIQEIEAKRAAEQARRIAAERQLLLQQQAAAAQLAASQQVVQPGLPQGSTWGSVAAKGWTSKTPTPATPSPGKKTMAQIQKEEEEALARLAKGNQGVGTSATSSKGYAGAAAVAAAKVLSRVGFC